MKNIIKIINGKISIDSKIGKDFILTNKCPNCKKDVKLNMEELNTDNKGAYFRCPNCKFRIPYTKKSNFKDYISPNYQEGSDSKPVKIENSKISIDNLMFNDPEKMYKDALAYLISRKNDGAMGLEGLKSDVIDDIKSGHYKTAKQIADAFFEY